MTTTGLVLFAHGARDPRWAGPFEAVASTLRQQRPHLAVRLAFLEFMSPSLPDAASELVAQGCLDVQVLPLFLGTGGHVRKDLPDIMAALCARHPTVRFTLHPAVGEFESVTRAMAQAALGCVDAAP
jgi:sirohydrochlorin cobaltochelatase